MYRKIMYYNLIYILIKTYSVATNNFSFDFCLYFINTCSKPFNSVPHFKVRLQSNCHWQPIQFYLQNKAPNSVCYCDPGSVFPMVLRGSTPSAWVFASARGCNQFPPGQTSISGCANMTDIRTQPSNLQLIGFCDVQNLSYRFELLKLQTNQRT